MPSPAESNSSSIDLQINVNEVAEEHLTVLDMYLTDLKKAVTTNELEKIQHQFALLRSKISVIENLMTTASELTDPVKERLSAALAIAIAEKDKMETVIAMAVNLSQKSASQPSTSSGTHFKWNWIPIPFHGKATEWSTWWDQFRTTVHDNSTLASEFKMKCLNDCLKGEANEVLGNLNRTGENYEAAIASLTNRFGDPAFLSKAYYSTLDAVPRATDLRSQRSTLDKIHAVVRNLNEIAHKIAPDEQMLIDKIMGKFPEEVMRWVIHEIRHTKPDLRFSPSELLVAMESTLQVDDFIARHRAEEEPNGSSPASSPKPVGVLAVGMGKKRPHTSSTKESRACVFCGLFHPSYECRKFATINARKAQLTALKKCINCLMQFHLAEKCRNPPATCERCKKSHNTALCVVKSGNNDKKTKKGKLYSFSGTFLRTFICSIVDLQDRTLEVRGLLDPGSALSFITIDIVKKLKLRLGNPFSLDCVRFSDSSATSVDGAEVIVCLNTKDRERKFFRFHAVTCIAGDLVTSPSPSMVDQLLPTSLEYADYDIFENNPRPIKILIGADLYHELVKTNNTRVLPSGVHLIDTSFGWCPSGGIRESVLENYSYPPTKKICSSFLCSTSVSRKQAEPELISQESESTEPLNTLIYDDENIEKMWKLEALGIENPNTLTTHDLVIDYYKKTTYVDHLNRKNVRLPWKDYSEIPSNFRIALARLKQLLENTSPDLLQTGDDHFKKQYEIGVIEDAPPLAKICHTKKSDEPIRIHYLPHRWLIQKDKFRAVYDASSNAKNSPCLNDLIYPGYNLTQEIVKLLINFRLYAIGIVADIEKAYLQISLNEVDRDATRFLWLKDKNKPVTQENLWYLRFARLPFGLNIAPFLLNMVLQDVFSTPPINEFLTQGQDRFYVDNLVTSVASSTEAIGFFEALTERLSSIQMNLRDWTSNDKQVLSALPNEKLDKTPGTISVLGLNWDRENDNLIIKLNLDLPTLGTKCNVLRFYASIYDPLGLLSPCTLELKILIQKCWKLKYKWTEVLPPQLNAEWLKLRQEAQNIPTIKIPRQLWNYQEPGTYELHIFCDASHKAYACGAYLAFRSVGKNAFKAQLIFSKCRLVPISMDTKSTPRLELMGLLIGMRISTFIQKILSVSLSTITLWTDSTTNLQWLHTKEVLPPFVKNRITEIKKVPNRYIKYVPSEQNPADIASRGKSATLLKNNALWWNGPQWLPYERLWPKPPINVENFKTSPTDITCATFVIAKMQDKEKCLLTEELEKKMTSWTKRVGAFFIVIKFCFLKSKKLTGNTLLEQQQKFKAIEAQVTIMAENLLIIELQRKYFFKEYTLLKKGQSAQNNLDLFLDENDIIRCKGRLLYARFPWETKHPILLPRDSPATCSYIREVHEQNAHIGVSHMLAKVRERFWITKGRAKIRSIIHSCYKCKFWEGGAYKLPPIPPLPEARLCEVTPFLQVGIDFFGPLHIKNMSNDILDVHALIITCLVTRAVHLEPVPDTSGEQFLLAFERFCSLRRVPKLVVSDNGKAFTFIQPLLGVKVAIRDHKINAMLNANRIDWNFIPEYSPWHGGVYERLIGLIKRCLKKSYGKVFLTYIELHTVLYKIADIINSRPLSYISSEEVVEPITPNHFLKLGPTNINMTIEPTPKPPLSATGAHLIDKWKMLTGILDAYWDAFNNLYLLSLRERHTTHHSRKKGQVPFQPKIGDVVLVKETTMPRAYWKLGKIEKLDKRQAIAFVRSGGRTLIRSINRLYPLETTREPSPPTTSS